MENSAKRKDSGRRREPVRGGEKNCKTDRREEGGGVLRSVGLGGVAGTLSENLYTPLLCRREDGCFQREWW